MDGSKPPSISPLDLYGAIGTAAASVVIDVRRSAAFAADNRMIVGAIRRDPEAIQSWRHELPAGRALVVYCAHGHEESQGAASALRSAPTPVRRPVSPIRGSANRPPKGSVAAPHDGRRAIPTMQIL